MTLNENNNILAFHRPSGRANEATRVSDEACKVYVLNKSATVIFLPESRQKKALSPFQDRWQGKYSPISRLCSSVKTETDGSKAILPAPAFRAIAPVLTVLDNRDLESPENEGMLFDDV